MSVERMLSVIGFVKNSRRSSIAVRLNSLCFVHDNYNNFFSILSLSLTVIGCGRLCDSVN